MELKRIDDDFSVCKLNSERDLITGKDFYFVGKTDDEISLVCITEDVPENTIERHDGWKAFSIKQCRIRHCIDQITACREEQVFFIKSICFFSAVFSSGAGIPI
jgi:hypothetical protein